MVFFKKQLTTKQKILLGAFVLLSPFLFSFIYTTVNQFIPPIHQAGDIGDPIKGSGNFICSNFGTRSHGFIEEKKCEFPELFREFFEMSLAFYAAFFIPIIAPEFSIFPKTYADYLIPALSVLIISFYLFSKHRQRKQKTIPIALKVLFWMICTTTLILYILYTFSIFKLFF